MQGLDLPKVSAWLSANVDGLEAPFTAELIAGGRSNLTFKMTDATGRAFVLRRPPTGHVLATAHDMAREHRIISALAATDVPVAPVVEPAQLAALPQFAERGKFEPGAAMPLVRYPVPMAGVAPRRFTARSLHEIPKTPALTMTLEWCWKPRKTARARSTLTCRRSKFRATTTKPKATSPASRAIHPSDK